MIAALKNGSVLDNCIGTGVVVRENASLMSFLSCGQNRMRGRVMRARTYLADNAADFLKRCKSRHSEKDKEDQGSLFLA